MGMLQDAMTGDSAGSRSTTPVSVRSPQQAKQPAAAGSKAGHLSGTGAKSAHSTSRPGTAAGRPTTAAPRSKATGSKGTAAEPESGHSQAPLQATSALH